MTQYVNLPLWIMCLGYFIVFMMYLSTLRKAKKANKELEEMTDYLENHASMQLQAYRIRNAKPDNPELWGDEK